ncbi:MAG: hypothetical protein GMKNLPBB_01076 [Myxococcota bacterium]|nr:hypothetical protein [Myxococcota bacterium]
MAWTDGISPHGGIAPLASNLWVVTGALKNMPLPRNMVIYRMRDGGLLIHSAIAMTDEAMAAMEKLGKPSIMIVPTRYHRLDAPRYKKRYPDIRVLCPKGSDKFVREVVQVDGHCEDVFKNGGMGVRAIAIDGVKPIELAYELDVDGGKALVVCDCLFHLKEGNWFQRNIMRVVGYFGMTPIGKMFLLQDRARYRQWLEDQSRREDWKAVIVAHGEPVTSGCSARLKEAADRLK